MQIQGENMRAATVLSHLYREHTHLFNRSCEEITLKENLPIAIPIVAAYILIGAAVASELINSFVGAYNYNEKEAPFKNLLLKILEIVGVTLVSLASIFLTFDLALKAFNEKSVADATFKYTAFCLHFPLLTFSRAAMHSPTAFKEGVKNSKIAAIAIYTTGGTVLKNTLEGAKILGAASYNGISTTTSFVASTVKTVYDVASSHFIYCYQKIQ